MKKSSRLGKLPPKHTFILNPYTDARFTRCPTCENKTKLRKFALFIHIEPMDPTVLGKTCRYCPACDLIIAHQDELEALLEAIVKQRDPDADLTSDDYLVLGTVERKVWREGMKHPKSISELLAHMHDFKEVRTIRPADW